MSFYKRAQFASQSRVLFLFIAAGLAAGVQGGPRDRITRPVDSRHTRTVAARLHQLADPKFDQGALDPRTDMNDVLVMFKLSGDQQNDLDRLLADQQNSSSPQFHKWLTPEEFGNRFGLSSGDQSKVAAWLQSEGLTVKHLGRGRNWISFHGTAAQMTKSLHTPIHRFQVGGETHYSNISAPSVPEALADVVEGFLGLDDFRLQPLAIQVPPDYNSGNSHFLVPEDFATIYNVSPLYQAGLDGTGQSIAVVGQSDVLLSDLRAFRTRYNLPANDPTLAVSGTDPGFTSSQLEGNLDLEWAGAIAPKAKIIYIAATNAFNAVVAAVEANVAPVITISYGFCEINYSAAFYRSIAQQGNAQGITLLSASGDSGAAGCQDRNAFATRGKSIQFPSAVPEITAVGGTQFVEGSGNYWAATNSVNLGSARSYIPEAAWNESSASGLASTGGGASIIYPQPAWQNGPGVPSDGARHTPDISLSAALHDAYFITYLGANGAVGGTSASAPSMAGVVALLNQYQVQNGFQKTPGLGNINPQLYRLAQSAPSIFHDIVDGDNIVPCAQGTPDCDTGSYGYKTGTAYDMATGLGSVDANALVTQWNTAINGVTVTLSADSTRGTLNDTIQFTATVAAAKGSGTPTGTVDFVFNGLALGTAPLNGGTASIALPLYKLSGIGTATLRAEYSGDAAFSGGGAALPVTILAPTGAAGIIMTGPNTVFPNEADAQGMSWPTTLTIREISGVPALITGFTIDGKDQTLSQYFPAPAIPPSGSVTSTIVLRGITAFVTKTFGLTGTDANGKAWSRQVAVNYYPSDSVSDFSFLATPLTVTQNTSADPSCQWSLQLNVDDVGGFGVYLLNGLAIGQVDSTASLPSIFGTARLAEFGGLQGTLCFGGINPPVSNQLYLTRSDGAFNLLQVSFAPPPATPAKLTPSPTSVTLASPKGQTAQTTLAVNLSDKGAAWTASVFPANRTTQWLSASQLSGTGTTNVTLTANGAGFEPGVYRATIVLQSQTAVPQYVNVPVMFVYGGAASGMTITGVGNSFSFKPAGAPGMLLSVIGTGLAGDTPAIGTGGQYPYKLGGVSATVNGIAAPVLYASSTLVNIQIPYEVGAGPAVVGINNNGQIVGAQFQMAASAPGIFADASGNILPSSTVTAGGYGTVFLTGVGDVSPARLTGLAESLTTPVGSLPKPVLPVSVTIDGAQALVQFIGLGPGKLATTQINFIVPASIAPGAHKVIVTVNGVASPTVNLTVTAPPSSTN